ncbi:MAG: zinc-dependent metalloprotease [Acidimicrobiales bacterium]
MALRCPNEPPRGERSHHLAAWPGRAGRAGRRLSDTGPSGGGGPFDDLMRNLARMFTSQGPINWEIARQLAQWTATGGQGDVNPDPGARIRLEELLRVAELQVGDITGLPTPGSGMLRVRAVSRSEWALLTLDAWRPLLERLAGAMNAGGGATLIAPPDPEAVTADPMGQLLGNLPQVLGPFLFGMQSGAMVGQLAARAMGQYDLPMPRPATDELLFVPRTIDGFASDWSLAADDIRLWICLREVTAHAVLGRPHVRSRLDEMIGAYVGAFRPDPSVLEDRLGGIDPTDMAAMQSILGDPEALLGEMQSDEQRRLQVPLQALLAAIAGYVDHVMATVGRRLIASYEPLTEALHRRRLEEEPGGRMLGQLLGVTLDAAGYERGQAFVRGVLERAGEEGLGRLWGSSRELPTAAELDAPGLWLARIDLPES